MSFLHTIFADAPKVAGELARDEERVQQELPTLVASFAQKQRILERLLDGESVYLHLNRLEQLLANELAMIEQETTREREILDDLRFLSRDTYLRRLDALRARLGQAMTKDEFLATALSDLHDVLAAQARKVRKLQRGRDEVGTAQGLVDLMLIERDIIERIGQVEDLRGLYRDLATGVRREAAVRRIHGRLERQLGAQLRAIAIGDDGRAYSMDGSYLSDLAARAFNHLEEGISEAVETGAIAGHDRADAEYVASTWFDEFVRAQVRADADAGKAVPSDRTITRFIGAFRQLYLAQADADDRAGAVA